MKKFFAGLFIGLSLLAIIVPSWILAESNNTGRFALIAISPGKIASLCVDVDGSSILNSLQTTGFEPKQDDSGFIFSLIGVNAPRSTDPASAQNFWGFWTGQDQLQFSTLGPAKVVGQADTRYVFNLGDGSMPTNVPNFTSVCPPSSLAPTLPSQPNQPSATPQTPAVPTQNTLDLGSSFTYLRNNYNQVAPNGQDWIALALGTNGQTSPTNTTSSSETLDLARNILAKASQGTDRQALISKLESNFSNNQFGEANQINNDMFAVLAVQSTDPSWLTSHSGVFQTLAASQRQDGSFGFSTTSDADVDLTAAALWSLKLAPQNENTAVNKAFGYLEKAKHSDGSFGFTVGATSNIPSTSWASIAYTAFGKDDSTTITYLKNARQADGTWFFGGQSDVLSTAYAVMALAQKPLPILMTNMPTNSPISSTPTSTPTSSGSINSRASQLVVQSTTPFETFSQTACSASASASATANGQNATASASATASCSTN